ncbi:hypothetical protein P3T76_015980 [Phytophthora citrophthora]|uniref:Uncharacterized protein n=1 Tax=Phytophthora citrophthora TaxID=4793 RepID=A0AAD9FYH0_9STRA|nr:hypothetical protein P3T76_015980 [Phytophthora citrophthora]
MTNICSTDSYSPLFNRYAMIFSKLLPEDSPDIPSSNLLVALERDVYYCYLIPLTIPVTILTFYANWVSLKFFRHN